MLENMDDISLEEHAFLEALRPRFNKLPKSRSYVIQPTKYFSALRNIERIINTIFEISPEAKSEIIYDELLGTGMSLIISDWSFSFYDCNRISRAISLADTFDIEAKLDGTVCLCFGFQNVRSPIFFKKD